METIGPPRELCPQFHGALGAVAKIVKELRERTKSGGRVQGKCPAACWHGCVNLTESLKERLADSESCASSIRRAAWVRLQGIPGRQEARRRDAFVCVLETNATVRTFAFDLMSTGYPQANNKAKIRKFGGRKSRGVEAQSGNGALTTCHGPCAEPPPSQRGGLTRRHQRCAAAL